MEKQQFYMLTEAGIKVLAEQITENIKKAIQPSESSADDVYMTLDETSKIINLTKSSIYGLVHKNKIPYHKKGKLYFLKSEIIEWLKSGRHHNKQEIETLADEYLMKNQLFNR
jgi:excisionase family DNA binding protein